LYVLDCGCHHDCTAISAQLQQMVQQQLLPPTLPLQPAVRALQCPLCAHPVSNADLYKLLGSARLIQVYKALVHKVQQEYEIQQQSVDLPVCAACSCTMLPVAAVYSSTGQVQAAALRARRCSVPNSAAECCKQLGLQLGPSCKFFCVSCNRQLPGCDSLAADGSDGGVSQPAVAAAGVAVQLWQQLVILEGEMVADKTASQVVVTGGSAGKAAGRGRGGSSSSSSSKAQCSGKAKSGWASGTGGVGQAHASRLC
jgi:hypothetical protein